MQNDYKNFDWKALLEKLPVKKTTEERAKRRALWKSMDMNGNGFLSLAEFDRGIIDVLNLPDLFKQKKIILRAFTSAKNKVKGKKKQSGDFVELLEFRYILIYLRQYLEYYAMFCRLDTSDDFKINLDDILIIHDDLDMNFGRIKVVYDSSSGGHNGIKDIEKFIGTKKYTRLKIGISNDKTVDTKDYVLGKFTDDEINEIKLIFINLSDFVFDFCSKNLDELMCKYNRK